MITSARIYGRLPIKNGSVKKEDLASFECILQQFSNDCGLHLRVRSDATGTPDCILVSDWVDYDEDELFKVLDDLKVMLEDGAFLECDDNCDYWQYTLVNNEWFCANGCVFYSDYVTDDDFYITRKPADRYAVDDIVFKLTPDEIRLAYQFYNHQCQYEDLESRFDDRYPEASDKTRSYALKLGKKLINEGRFDNALSNVDTYYEIYWDLIDYILDEAKGDK